MTKIQTRPFIFGDEKESAWPPRFPTCRGFRGYWDSESRTFKEGTPPPREKKYGDAPAIFTDSIEPYYHPAAGITVDSKSALRDLDKACGTITTDKKLPPDPTEQKARAEKRRKEGTEALHKAVAQIDAGTAPLTEAQRAACTKENERLSSALNFDAFNVAGRKNDRRGKRWKKR